MVHGFRKVVISHVTVVLNTIPYLYVVMIIIIAIIIAIEIKELLHACKVNHDLTLNENVNCFIFVIGRKYNCTHSNLKVITV